MRDDERLRKHSLDKTLPPVVLPKPRRSSAESKREIFARNRSLTTPTSPTANFFGDSSIKDRRISNSSNSNEPPLEEMKEEVRIDAKTELADEVFDEKIEAGSLSETKTETPKTDSVDQTKIEKQEILDTSIIEEAIETSKKELASDSNNSDSNCVNSVFVSDSEFNTEAKAMTEDVKIAKSKTKEGLRKLSDAIDELESLTFESIDKLPLKEESTGPEESNETENKLLDEQITSESQASNDKFVQDTKELAKIDIEIKQENTEENVKQSLDYEGIKDSTEANVKIENVTKEMQIVDDKEVADDSNLNKECESVESNVNSGKKNLKTKIDNEGERKKEEPQNLLQEEVVDDSNLKTKFQSVESDINSDNKDLETKIDNEGEKKQEKPENLAQEEVLDDSNRKKECESVESDINSDNKDLEIKIDNEGERKQEKPENLVQEEAVDDSNLKKECESVESDVDSGNKDLETKIDNEGERKQEEPENLVNTCIVEVERSNKPESNEKETKTEENKDLNLNCGFSLNDGKALQVPGSPDEVLPSKKEPEINTTGSIVGTVQVNPLMADADQEKSKESEVESSPHSADISKELNERKGELHANLNYVENLDKKEEPTDKMSSNLEQNESSQERDESSERERKSQSSVESLNESNNSNDVSQQPLEPEKDKKAELGEIQSFNQNEIIVLDTDTKFNVVDDCVSTKTYEKLECKSETAIVETFGEKQEVNNNNNNNNEISRITVEIET